MDHETVPECDKTAPTVRAPAGPHEGAGGGWTCKGYGQKNDKRGNPR
jgi:hypothetical protein